jgi:hypothetical protein
MYNNAQDVYDVVIMAISDTFTGLVALRYAAVSDDGYGRQVRWGQHAKDTLTVTRTMN